MGDGAFGRVLLCINIFNNIEVAIKIIKPVQRYIESGKIESEILFDIKKKDFFNNSHCMKIIESFTFIKDNVNYFAIVTEKLGYSLYDYIKMNNYYGFPLRNIQIFAKEILEGVNFLHKNGFIDSDLKPENILFSNNDYTVITSDDKLPLNVIKKDLIYENKKSKDKKSLVLNNFTCNNDNDMNNNINNLNHNNFFNNNNNLFNDTNNNHNIYNNHTYNNTNHHHNSNNHINNHTHNNTNHHHNSNNHINDNTYNNTNHHHNSNNHINDNTYNNSNHHHNNNNYNNNNNIFNHINNTNQYNNKINPNNLNDNNIKNLITLQNNIQNKNDINSFEKNQNPNQNPETNQTTINSYKIHTSSKTTLESSTSINPNKNQQYKYQNPENQLFSSLKPYYIPSTNNNPLKIIDFGGVLSTKDKISDVINTRQYRAPEDILQCCIWDEKSDIWSIGCILYELYTGEVLFPTHDDQEHLCMIEKICGKFPEWMILKGVSSVKKIFNLNKNTINYNCLHKKHDVIKNVDKVIKIENGVLEEHFFFKDFLMFLLQVDPKKRPTGEEALKHKFFNIEIME